MNTLNNTPKEILIVEDDSIAQLIIQHNLKLYMPECAFRVACNGFEALQYIKGSINKLPTAITLDLNMPTMNGFEFVEALKSLSIHIPVFIVTSSTLSEDIEKCKNYDLIYSIYAKPFLKNSAEDIYTLLSKQDKL